MAELILDEIPELVKSKKLSVSQACIEMYKIIYTNYPRFNLKNFDEDTRSDFLLYFLEKKAKTIIERFNPEIATFGSYVYSTLQSAQITFLNSLALKSDISNSVLLDSILTYDDKMEEEVEKVTAISDEEPVYKYSRKAKKEKIPSLVYKQIFKKVNHRLPMALSKQRKIQQGLLILALKSAWYINDEQIKKVSRICDISPEIITNSVCALKSKLITKALNRREIEKSRNRAYCFVNTYRHELELTDPDENKFKYKEIKRKLDYQTSAWTNKNQLLLNGRFKIAPTNSEIADVMGLPYRLISASIMYFKKVKSSVESACIFD
ncbi:MAG: hypothetical protein J6Y36_06900 [Treponema sp.]|nr:hypothetical protein [Treponema sp.]